MLLYLDPNLPLGMIINTPQTEFELVMMLDTIAYLVPPSLSYLPAKDILFRII
jgi:hypothetical protein